MNDLLDRYGEQWRATQPAPPALDPGALHDRRRRPVAVATVAVLLAGGGVAVVSLRGGPAVTGPARLVPVTTDPTSSATTSPADGAPTLDRHAGTVADPVPWSDRAAGPADIPAPDPAGVPQTGPAPPTCPTSLTGSLTMRVAGARMTGSLRLAGTVCALDPYLAITLTSADGRVIAATASHAYDRLSQTADYRTQSLHPDTGDAFADLSSPLLCAQGPVTARVSDDSEHSVTVPVTRIPAAGCGGTGKAVLTATPLGLGRAAPIPATGYDRLLVSLAVPSHATGSTVDARLTLSNPTGEAIPLGRPCSAVAVGEEYPVPVGTAYSSAGGSRLNCEQAPNQVPAHGAVVFDVHLSAAAETTHERVTFSVGVAGIPGTASGVTMIG